MSPIKRLLSIAMCCLPGIIAMLGILIIVNGSGRQIMDINTLFLLVMGLGCPVMMGLMMWMMNRQMSQSESDSWIKEKAPLHPEEQIAQLELRRQLLDREIKQLKAHYLTPSTSIPSMKAVNHRVQDGESS